MSCKVVIKVGPQRACLHCASAHPAQPPGFPPCLVCEPWAACSLPSGIHICFDPRISVQGRLWAAPAATTFASTAAAPELLSPLTTAKAASQTPLGALECCAPSVVCHYAGALANINNAMFALCVLPLYWLPSPLLIVHLWRLVSCHFAQDMIRGRNGRGE